MGTRDGDGARKQQEALHEDILRRVVVERQRSGEANSKRVRTVFRVGDDVQVARPWKVNQLTNTLIVSWHVVVQREHMYTLEDLMAEKMLRVPVART